MSDLTNEQLLELIDDTLAWASDVAELWVSTLNETIIDAEVAQLTRAVEQNDLELARQLCQDLAITLNAAEERYERAEREY